MRLAGLRLGGTRCIAVLGERPTIAERREFPTSSPEQTLAAALGVLREWDAAAPHAGIGIASFRPVRVDSDAADFGRILTTPKPGWSGTDLLGRLRTTFA